VKATAIALVVTSCLASQAHAGALPGGFVYLRDIDPTIIQDVRYATSNNFVGHPLAGYEAAECIVKREVGLRLKAIQQELASRKLSLKMLDCYRPARARGQRRHGHGLRLYRRQGVHKGYLDHAGPASLARSARGRNGTARLYELFEGVVAFFPAGRGRASL